MYTENGYEILNRKIDQLKKENERLENMLFKMGAMMEAPCFICGYNGPGYYSPSNHK